MKRSRFTIIFALPLIALVLLIIIYLIGIPFRLTKNAAEIYGHPAESLGPVEKVYLSIYLILQKKALTTSNNPTGEDAHFHVELGESPDSVAARLHTLRFIPNQSAFRNYLIYTGIDTQIQAGDYLLKSHMTPIEIASALQDPTPRQIDFTILAGWRAEEIAASLPYSGLAIQSDEFLAEVEQENQEGFLFPGVYTLQRDISAETLVRTLGNAFKNNLSTELETGFAQNGLTVREAVVLASIVEREAVIDDEMPLLASVFINRLEVGMKLDADPTVQYALGYNQTQGTWWTNPLKLVDLEIDSPYNTYRYTGLPPGPICNPGENALRAVAFPAQTPYYYFRAACDNSGLHVFTETFQDHTNNACP